MFSSRLQKLSGERAKRLLHSFVLWHHLNLFLWFNKYCSPFISQPQSCQHFLLCMLASIPQILITINISDFSLPLHIHPFKTFKNCYMNQVLRTDIWKGIAFTLKNVYISKRGTKRQYSKRQYYISRQVCKITEFWKKGS